MESSAWQSHQHATIHNSLSISSNAGWRVEMESSACHFHQHATIHNSPPMICNAGWRVEMESSAWPFYQHATIHNSQTVISNAGWRVEMESSAWACHNVQLTSYDLQCRMRSENEVISMITHQHATIHNSQTMISNAGWSVVIELLAWPPHQHATMHSWFATQHDSRDTVISIITLEKNKFT